MPLVLRPVHHPSFARVTRLAPTLVLLAFSLAACSGAQQATAEDVTVLDIEQPPSGPLSDAQLSAIAADIRQLAMHPLAAGAEEGRRHLIGWITGSPDVSVSVCAGVAGFTGSESRYTPILLGQFIFASAAHLIENPGSDPVAVNVGGLEGALVTYGVLLEQRGNRARDSFMESMAELSESGGLESYVRSGLAEC